MIWHRIVIYDMIWYRIVWYRIIYDMMWYHSTWVRVVLGTSCLGYEMSWVRVVLGTSCLGYELSCVRIVLGTSCLGYELSWVRVVLGMSCPDPLVIEVRSYPSMMESHSGMLRLGVECVSTLAGNGEQPLLILGKHIFAWPKMIRRGTKYQHTIYPCPQYYLKNTQIHKKHAGLALEWKPNGNYW